MTHHRLEATRGTLHGHLSRDLPPALEVDPGDAVSLSALDAAWLLGPPDEAGAVESFPGRRPELDAGHALTGPILVRGAQPGMTLEVRIDEVVPGPWGWTRSGGWPSPLNRRLGVAGEGTQLVWSLDREAMVGRDRAGRAVRLRPFLGFLGVAPAEPGVHSTVPPHRGGGNIDCAALVAGSRLFLPVLAPGALFSAGDGHGAQGDGECGGTAIECPLERADLSFFLHDRPAPAWPRAVTGEGWLTFGFDRDLDEAMAIALEGMVELVIERFGASRSEAMALASVAVDLRVTQVVNDRRGVHAVLPHGAIR